MQCICICMYRYIYIYKLTATLLAPAAALSCECLRSTCLTPNLPTKIVGFRGFDSSIMLCLRGGIARPVGNFPESLTPAMLEGVMLVGRLGVRPISLLRLSLLWLLVSEFPGNALRAWEFLPLTLRFRLSQTL